MSTYPAVPATSLGIIIDTILPLAFSHPISHHALTIIPQHIYFSPSLLPLGSNSCLNCKSFLNVLPTTIFPPTTYSPQRSWLYNIYQKITLFLLKIYQ